MPLNLKCNVTPENLWTATCSDFIHPSCPELCSQAAWETWRDAFKFSVKLYTPLFLVPALVFNRKKPSHILTKTLPSIIRSSAFLATLGGGTIPISCFLRKVNGKINYPAIFLSGLGAGIVSILIEHPVRRPELALYTTNHLAETFFRMAVVRKWVKPIPYGNVWVFVVAMSCLCYLYNYKKENLGNIRGILKFLLGDKDEESVMVIEPVSNVTVTVNHIDTVTNGNGHNNGTNHNSDHSTNGSLVPPPQGSGHRRRRSAGPIAIGEIREKKVQVEDFHKNLLLAFKASVRAFGIGFGVKGGIGFLSNLLMKGMYKRPVQLITKSFGKETFRFAMFLATLVGGWRFTLAILKKIVGRDQPLNSVIAGAVSGLSMFMAPSTEIAMYFLSKAGEGVFRTGVSHGLWKPLPHGDVILFSIACSVLFYACIMEPFALRPSYFRFLNNCSNGRFAQFETVARLVNPVFFERSGFKY